MLSEYLQMKIQIYTNTQDLNIQQLLMELLYN